MRSAVLVALLVVSAACARPTSTVQEPTPTPTPTPSPSPEQLVPALTTFHAGEVGAVYTPVPLSATGGVQPYTWSISQGALPDGLSISAAGIVSGTPTRSGAFAFTAQVTGTVGLASLAGHINIADAPVAQLNPNCVNYCSVEVGCLNVCGDFGSLSGGTAPITFVWSGSVPAGTQVQGFSVQGTFTAPAVYQFTVTATDAFGLTASISPKFLVFPHISLVSGSCDTTFYKFGCKTALAYLGGTPGATPTASVVSATGQLCTLGVTGAPTCNPSTSPPPNFAATASGGAVTVIVPATTTYFTYNGTVTVALTDQSLCSAGTNCSATATVTITVQAG